MKVDYTEFFLEVFGKDKVTKGELAVELRKYYDLYKDLMKEDD